MINKDTISGIITEWLDANFDDYDPMTVAGLCVEAAIAFANEELQDLLAIQQDGGELEEGILEEAAQERLAWTVAAIKRIQQARSSTR